MPAARTATAASPAVKVERVGASAELGAPVGVTGPWAGWLGGAADGVVLSAPAGAGMPAGPAASRLAPAAREGPAAAAPAAWRRFSGGEPEPVGRPTGGGLIASG